MLQQVQQIDPKRAGKRHSRDRAGACWPVSLGRRRVRKVGELETFKGLWIARLQRAEVD